jgi:hypothetical protein
MRKRRPPITPVSEGIKARKGLLEHPLQVAIAEWMGWCLPPPIWWTGIDHAAKVSPRYGAMRKKRGIKKGIADFLVIAPGPNVVFLEVKREDGGSLTPEQKDFAASMHAVQVWCVTVRSVEQAERALRFCKVLPA